MKPPKNHSKQTFAQIKPSIDSYYRGRIETVKPPKILSHEPILLVPGLAFNATVFQSTMKMIAAREHCPVVSYWPKPQKTKLEDKRLSRYNAYQVENALELLSVVSRISDQPLNIIAHSQGAMSAVIAAQLMPEKIRSIVLVAPAGLCRGQHPFKLGARFIRQLIAYYKQIRTGDEAAKYRVDQGVNYFRSDLKEAIAECLSVATAKFSVRDFTAVTAKGVNMAILLMANDRLFPKHLLSRSLRYLKIPILVTKNTELDHDAIIHSPEAIEAALEVFRLMHRRSSGGQFTVLANRYKVKK